jgi:hypothetical protein
MKQKVNICLPDGTRKIGVLDVIGKTVVIATGLIIPIEICKAVARARRTKVRYYETYHNGKVVKESGKF